MSFEIIKTFENEVAKFYNAPYAIATDSCTHGVELCLRYFGAKEINVPKRTYLSIPFLAHKLNIKLNWKDENWTDYYYLTDNSSPQTIGGFTNVPSLFNKKIFKATTTTKAYLLDRNESERFEERIVYTMDDSDEVILNESNYSFKIDGYINDDIKLITFAGMITSGTPTEGLIETTSDYISEVESTTNALSFFMRGNDLIMKNNLGSTKKIILYRKKTK
jgi:hypothetical protein